MRIIFSILSIIYISAIFILAGSPIVLNWASFNPYSLLHIPLYGFLTLLLIFSIVPPTLRPKGPITEPHNLPKNSIDQNNSINAPNRFLIAGVIALGVGIADEIYQSYVPGRDASVTDVMLDLIGIGLMAFLIIQLFKKQKFSFKPYKK